MSIERFNQSLIDLLSCSVLILAYRTFIKGHTGNILRPKLIISTTKHTLCIKQLAVTQPKHTHSNFLLITRLSSPQGSFKMRINNGRGDSLHRLRSTR